MPFLTYNLNSFKWVEAEGFGDGGPTWVEDHIESFVNVAGPLLVSSPFIDDTRRGLRLI